MGIIEDLKLESIQTTETLRQRIKELKVTIHYRTSNTTFKKAREGNDQKEFLDALGNCIEYLDDNDGMVQTVIQTCGFACDTQSRKKEFKIEYNDIKEALEGNGEKSYFISKTLRENGKEILAGTWEQIAEKNGYIIPQNDHKSNGEEQPNQYSKKAKKNNEQDKNRLKGIWSTGDSILHFLKRIPILWKVVIIAGGLLFIAVINSPSNKDVGVKQEDKISTEDEVEETDNTDDRHPLYMVGTWTKEGAPLFDITLNSNGSCRYISRDGRWYVDGNKLYMSYTLSKKTCSIISDTEMAADWEPDHATHYKKNAIESGSEGSSERYPDLDEENR